MNDIVERLRSPEVFFTTGQMYSPVADAAADEIERLRAALEEVARWHDEHARFYADGEKKFKALQGIDPGALSFASSYAQAADQHRQRAVAIRALKDETDG